MGRLAGFKYRQIIKKLKNLGFVFDRQAAGSHEIWFNPTTDKYSTIPNHPGDITSAVGMTLEVVIVTALRHWQQNPTFWTVPADSTVSPVCWGSFLAYMDVGKGR